jgi:hypothetical protein
MGIFKKKIIKEIPGGDWGHLVNTHKMDVDTLSRDIRCVEREGFLEDKGKVHFLRVFRLSEIKEKGIEIDGWETFDQHPEVILFEGYWHDITNEADLERKKT